MSKKSLVLLIVAAFVMSMGLGVTMSLADNHNGTETITLNPDNRDAAKKGKPAVFPHWAHQEREKCGTCHHTDVDGKRTPIGDDGAGAAKCDTCHNADFANEKLRKWKDIGHGLCKNCHKEKKADGAPTKCTACHPKKKK
jgi:predicted CXXCH cytochrome family protein